MVSGLILLCFFLLCLMADGPLGTDRVNQSREKTVTQGSLKFFCLLTRVFLSGSARISHSHSEYSRLTHRQTFHTFKISPLVILVLWAKILISKTLKGRFKSLPWEKFFSKALNIHYQIGIKKSIKYYLLPTLKKCRKSIKKSIKIGKNMCGCGFDWQCS